MVSVLRTPFLFLYLLDNELLLAAKRKKGEGSWRLVEGERAAGGWSKGREPSLGLAEMGEAGDNVCGAGLLCQWAAALVWPRDGGGW
jgi:hypothetical protein